jgi:glycosidase
MHSFLAHFGRAGRTCTVWLLAVVWLMAGAGANVRTAAQSGENGQNTMGWWNDRVWYQIFVRSFQDSDGDGIGDFQGIIDRLDYLNDGDPATTDDLGITGIWLMPIMPAANYHGYDVLDYRAFHADYGTREDFQRLLDACRQRGIAVIIDLVLNHTGIEHPWFVASRARDAEYANWYVWNDRDPRFRGPDGQQVWHPLDRRYYYALFWGRMPDLNLTNPTVTDELYDISRYWLEEIGVDGFRLDAVKHFIEEGQVQENTPSTHRWLRDYRDYLREIAPDAFTIGEAWSTSFEAAEYVENGGVDLVFEFDLATTMVYSARQRNADGMVTMQNRLLDLYPPGQYGAFLTNHDQNRVMSELRGNIDAARVAASLLLTGPGVPFIYYGEEIGMTGIKPDERIRTPMQWTAQPRTAGFTTARQPWQPLGEGVDRGVSVEAQTGDPASLLSHYRALVHLRSAHPALRTGDYLSIDTDSRRVYAFLRRTPDETLLVLINVHDEPQTDYVLNAAGANLPESTPEVVFGPALPLPAAAAPGDLTDYQPFPELPPRSTTIVRFAGS